MADGRHFEFSKNAYNSFIILSRYLNEIWYGGLAVENDFPKMGK